MRSLASCMPGSGSGSRGLRRTSDRSPSRCVSPSEGRGMLLLMRLDDLAVLGMRWSGFRLDGATLEAGSSASVGLIFPLQHMAEEITDSGLARTRLFGGRHVVYAVDRAPGS